MLNERQKEILNFLRKQERATVRKMAKEFYVSEMTIRRDLNELEKTGLVNRYNGGAVFCGESGSLPIATRKFLHRKEKANLSEKTKKYLHNGMSVYIDSSSTALYMIPILAEFKDITIITNSASCLIAAAKYNIKCIMAGGELYDRDMCTVGGETIEFVRKYNTDIGFFSTLGISDDGIISDTDLRQSNVKCAAFQSCALKIFMFDSSKQHKKYLYTLCGVDDADDIIII